MRSRALAFLLVAAVLLVSGAVHVSWATTTEVSKPEDGDWLGTIAAGDTLVVTFYNDANNLTVDCKSADTVVIWSIPNVGERPMHMEATTSQTWGHLLLDGVKVTGSGGVETAVKVSWWRSRSSY